MRTWGASHLLGRAQPLLRIAAIRTSTAEPTNKKAGLLILSWWQTGEDNGQSAPSTAAGPRGAEAMEEDGLMGTEATSEGGGDSSSVPTKEKASRA